MSKSIEVKAADNIRILSAAMVEKAKSGHPGGAMGGADYIHVLYSEFLNFDPSDMVFSPCVERILQHGRSRQFPSVGQCYSGPS